MMIASILHVLLVTILVIHVLEVLIIIIVLLVQILPYLKEEMILILVNVLAKKDFMMMELITNFVNLVIILVQYVPMEIQAKNVKVVQIKLFSVD